tara:strand:- start:4764 stop:4982 length:219 start_codon:yes stop_codon:yes gene_type:complete
MSFAKKFLEKNPINLSHLYKSNDINPLQYKLLAPKYIKGGSIKIPHSYSNKYDKIQMRNTLELLYELFKNNK